MVEFGEYIQVFGLEHFIYLGGVIFLGLFLFTKKKWITVNRDVVTNILIIVLLIQQLILYSSYVLLNQFTLGESLPFHISRISTIMVIVFLIKKNKKLYNTLCYFGVFAYLSFIYPSRIYGITHPLGISYFVSHAVTLLLPYYGMIAYQMKIETKERINSFKWLISYIIFCLIVNPLIDGNYFYLKEKPLFSSLPDIVYVPLLVVFSYFLFIFVEKIYRFINMQLLYSNNRRQLINTSKEFNQANY